MIKLSKLAKDLGVSRVTLYNWKNEGKINFIKHNNSKMNFVTLDTYNSLLGVKQVNEEKVVIYCRVSSSENKSNLETQKERLISYCNAKGYKVDKVITEIGSGVNDDRPKLIKLLSDNDYTKIVVEHKDRLTRVGFNYFETFTKVLNKEIEVVNNVSSPEEDIVQDFIYTLKIFNKNITKTKGEQIIKELNS